jgi:hypothetical protein
MKKIIGNIIGVPIFYFGLTLVVFGHWICEKTGIGLDLPNK